VPIFTYLLLGRNVWDNFFVTWIMDKVNTTTT
jgi:hypothetical protein